MPQQHGKKRLKESTEHQLIGAQAKLQIHENIMLTRVAPGRESTVPQEKAVKLTSCQMSR